MFEPMTASPVTPICAVPVLEFDWLSDELMSSPLRLDNFCYMVSVTLWHSGVGAPPRDAPGAALEVEQPLQLGEPRHRQRDGGHHQNGCRSQQRHARQQRERGPSPDHP